MFKGGNCDILGDVVGWFLYINILDVSSSGVVIHSFYSLDVLRLELCIYLAPLERLFPGRVTYRAYGYGKFT